MVRKNFIYCITNRGGGGYWLPEVTITAYSPVWDNWKDWYRENNDPYLIWGGSAGNNVGGMFGPMSVSGTRKYWQNMSMGGGGFAKVGGGITLSEASTIATAIGVVNELKMRLINWGLKSASGGENPIIKYLQFSKAMGKILGRFSAGVYFYNGVLDFQKGNNMSGIHNMINTSMSLLMTEGGALGLYSGGVYFLINETVGWPEMGRRQYQIIQNNPYWWQVYAH